jgi:hypothetical protein
MGRGQIIYTPAATSAITLDGAHYLSLADDADFDFGTADFAVDALLRIDADTPDAEAVIAAKGAASLGGAAGWHFVADTVNLKLGLRINDGDVAAAYVASNAAAFSLGAWFWARVTADRDGNATFYVNGVSVGAGAVSAAAGSLNNSEALKVGGQDASASRLKGAMDFLRFDAGRLLSAAWAAREWDRLRYGARRSVQDFLELWSFEESLTGDSDAAHILAWQGGGGAAYETGYPASEGTITYQFGKNFQYGHEDAFLDVDDRQRSLDGGLFSYVGARKSRLVVKFPAAALAQVVALQAAWAGGRELDFYEDADLPRTCQALMAAPPAAQSVANGLYELEIELEET